MKINIAGRITGENREQCINKFKAAEELLKSRGNQVANPMKMESYDLEYDIYMIIDRMLIDACDAICLLPDWEQSKGAKKEQKYAELQNKEIITLKNAKRKDILLARFPDANINEIYPCSIAQKKKCNENGCKACAKEVWSEEICY